MAITVTFDTLKFVETLKASGFDEVQAKGMAAAIREVQDTHLDELTTKRDFKELDTKLDNRLKELELRMAAEIAPLKWGMAVTVGGIMALVVKGFLSH